MGIMLVRTEATLMDPVYTGKIMFVVFGLSRKALLERGEKNVRFIHTGGARSLHAY
jgi:1-aminocyclopropane-1-carboxylate deaminase/D-cysteine desulfhydrase-like pyridoxal-dependent ACC family enzyme